MQRSSLRQLFSTLFILFIGFFAAAALQAWTGPTATAPDGNVAAPINVGTTDQVKNAGLSLNSLLVSGNAAVYNSGTNVKLGVNTASPVVALDVNGTLRLADGGEVCQAVTAGTLHFNSNTGKLEYCNGTDWYVINSTVAEVSSGTQTFTSGGTFTIPAYASLTVTVRGGGGGGGGYAWVYNGGSGTGGIASSISSLGLAAQGGSGGGGSYSNGSIYVRGADGAGGTASGCDTNTTGGSGNGGTGGFTNSQPGGDTTGGNGGGGGYCVKTYTYGEPGSPLRDSSLTVVIGSGGSKGADGYPGLGTSATNGAGGSVTFTWE